MEKMGEIDVTCVMPVHNSEAYLEMTMSSLCAQTLQNIEIICVDDASTDASLELLEEFAKKDSRIRIIRNPECEGAANSRNKGLKEARGRYIIFLDSDDYFYPNMLEEAFRLAVQNDADLVAFSSEWIGVRVENGEEFHSKLAQTPKKSGFYTNENKDNYCLDIADVVPWNKLVRREFLLKNHIVFQNIPACNDVAYAVIVGILAPRVVISDKVLMKYFFGRNGSITHGLRQKGVYVVEAWKYIFDFLEKQNKEYSFRVLLYKFIKDTIHIFRNHNYTKEGKKAAEEVIFQSKKIAEVLQRAKAIPQLYPYEKEFIRRVEMQESLSQIRYMEYFMPEVTELIESCTKENKKLAIWGCGKNGKELLEELERKQLKVSYVVDSAEEKLGILLNGYRITKYEDIKEQVDVILVTTPRHFDEIKEIARGKQVVSLLEC